VNKIGVAVSAMGALALLSVGGCDRVSRKDSARADRGDYSTQAAGGADRQAAGDRAGGGRVARAPTYKDGRPVWAANRRRTADENIQRMYQRNGADFGASSSQDYVARAHAFLNSPPAGVQTATRSNGDKLYYDARTNTFLVATRNGAPRIMMKPRDGAAYWKEQLASLDRRGGYGQNRNRQGAGGYQRADGADSGSDDNG
jgi:hypothetical protein